MFDVGKNIHCLCNVFNNVLLYEIILILLLFNYGCIILALTSILDDVHLLHTYPCTYVLILNL